MFPEGLDWDWDALQQLSVRILFSPIFVPLSTDPFFVHYSRKNMSCVYTRLCSRCMRPKSILISAQPTRLRFLCLCLSPLLVYIWKPHFNTRLPKCTNYILAFVIFICRCLALAQTVFQQVCSHKMQIYQRNGIFPVLPVSRRVRSSVAARRSAPLLLELISSTKSGETRVVFLCFVSRTHFLHFDQLCVAFKLSFPLQTFTAYYRTFRMCGNNPAWRR